MWEFVKVSVLLNSKSAKTTLSIGHGYCWYRNFRIWRLVVKGAKSLGEMRGADYLTLAFGQLMCIPKFPINFR